MKEVGEVAVKIVPKVEEGRIKSAFTRLGNFMKKSFSGTASFFGKAGGFLTGLNQTLEIVNKIKEVIEKMRGIVDDLTKDAGDLSDFAQSVGLGGGQEYKLAHILAQLSAGGVGEQTGRQLVEQLTRRIASGQVQVQAGLNQADAIVSAFRMLQSAKSESERLQLFSKLFGRDVKASGDILSAISAYGTHSAERLGKAGTKSGLQAIQRGLEYSDYTRSEIAHAQITGKYARFAQLGNTETVIDPATGLANAVTAQALVDATKIEEENKLKQVQMASGEAIIAQAKVMASIENMMIEAGGWMGKFAGKLFSLLEKMAGDDGGKQWWNPLSWGKEQPEER